LACFFHTKLQNCGAILVTIRIAKVTIHFLQCIIEVTFFFVFFFHSLPCEIALLPDLYAKYGCNCASASSLSREYSISTGSAQNRESPRLPLKYFNSTRKETYSYQLTTLVKALHFCTCMSSISETTFQPQTIVVTRYVSSTYINMLM